MILAAWYQDPATAGLIGAALSFVLGGLTLWAVLRRDKASSQAAFSDLVLKDNEIWRDRFEALEAKCQRVEDENEALKKRVLQLERNGGAAPS